MPRFQQGSPEERAAQEQQEARDQASAESLARGGLPLRAQERLAQERAPDGRPRIWTSDLSVDELLAAHAVSFEPVSQVFGSSIYHIAYDPTQFQYNQTDELSVFSSALYHARELAMGRMLEEAQTLGAHGVIGVRLEHREYEWGTNLLEFTAIGTAVRLVGWKGKLPRPFTSDLSGEEFLKLLHAGYVPVAMAMGTVAYYVVTTWFIEQQLRAWNNIEITAFSGAVSDARNIAISRMAQDAHRVHADGIVGSDLTIRVEEVAATRQVYNQWRNEYEMENFEDHVIEILAFGTAIAEIGRGHEAARPTLALNLNHA
jgi:uncharacterized protein YbjQ (UPF0145 family)